MRSVRSNFDLAEPFKAFPGNFRKRFFIGFKFAIFKPTLVLEMHILYLDDSGSAANINEDYFVLGGVSVPESSIRWLSNELEKLADHLNQGSSRSSEFHAAEIFRGKSSIWRTMTKPERIETVKQVLGVLKNSYGHTTLFASAVHKNSYPNQDPVSKAYEDVSSRFNLYLERIGAGKDSQERGIIVFDKSSYEHNIQKMAADFRESGNRWGSNLRQICEVPFFVDSKASRLIQLADHIAYAVFRFYNANDRNYIMSIESRFDSADHVVHGLSHLTNDNNCMCLACFTRRISAR